jgi:hypothetical protein
VAVAIENARLHEAERATRSRQDEDSQELVLRAGEGVGIDAEEVIGRVRNRVGEGVGRVAAIGSTTSSTTSSSCRSSTAVLSA